MSTVILNTVKKSYDIMLIAANAKAVVLYFHNRTASTLPLHHINYFIILATEGGTTLMVF